MKYEEDVYIVLSLRITWWVDLYLRICDLNKSGVTDFILLHDSDNYCQVPKFDILSN